MFSILNNEDGQTRLNIITSLKELGEQVKELERTIHKDAGKDSKDGKMGNDFSKGVDSAVSIITDIITGDMTGGLAGVILQMDLSGNEMQGMASRL
ncbi:hypothetical protein DKK70_00750 [Gilliamella apicola]|uniref:Uncharacterized protein n=1 Tax=Gilliamella apicola TaxID=1196095 RepID=A0A2V4E5U6_9GAMM|nr:hypothetical protein [Gilliamella apicola]PXZ08680.1 hypothetical protein DKK70_00750 [Gilliamella apicola]